MRKLTVAEQRERELNKAVVEFGFNYEVGKHLMNRFYRLNADLERLSYLENDSRTCDRRSTKELSESYDRRIKKLNADFEPFGLCLDSASHLMSICYKGTTKTAIYDFYYE